MKKNEKIYKNYRAEKKCNNIKILYKFNVKRIKRYSNFRLQIKKYTFSF